MSEGMEGIPQSAFTPKPTEIIPPTRPVSEPAPNQPAIEPIQPQQITSTPEAKPAPEIQSQQKDEHPGLLRMALNKVKSIFDKSSQDSSSSDQIDQAMQTQLSRRAFLQSTAGVAVGATLAAAESKIAQAAPSKRYFGSPFSEEEVKGYYAEKTPMTKEQIVQELRERTYSEDPGLILSSAEQEKQNEEISERIFENVQEMLNKRGLLTPSQIDESKLYPSYYLDNGGKVTGRNKGEFAQDSTLKWLRDYRPINTYGLRFNLPLDRVPEKLKNILPKNPRSVENWRDIVKQFGLDNPENKRYQPDEYTYCNFAARDMLRAFGVGDIPQWFKDFSTGELRETVTNIMFRQIKQYGTFNLEKYQQEGENAREWILVDKKGALEHAKGGKPVVLLVGRSTGVGHMAILNPDSTEEKLIVAQAGSKVGSAIEWDESHYSPENNYTETLFLVHKLDFEKPSIG